MNSNGLSPIPTINAYRIRQAIACSLGVGAFSLGSMGAIAPLANAQTYLSSSSPAFSPAIAQSPTPVTYVTEVSSDQIVIEITEGEFYFHGYLERTSGNVFVGHDEQVRVIYDRDASRVVVINVQTGDEYYNYFFSTADEGAL